MTGTSSLYKAAVAYERSLAQKRAVLQQNLQSTQKALSELPTKGESKEWLRRLTHVQAVVNKYWPVHWPLFEACLSGYVSLLLQDVTQGIGIVLIGDSGAGKGTILDPFRDVSRTVWRDKFTPASLNSGYADGVTVEQADERALYREAKHKVLLIGDLGTILNGSREALASMYSTIPPWLDGQGLSFSHGTHGAHGQKGDFSFVLVGGTTPINKTTWRAMASVGPRFLFLRVAKLSTSEFISPRTYGPAKAEISTAVQEFLNWVFSQHKPRTLPWPEYSDEQEKRLMDYASLIARGQTLAGEYGEEVLRVTSHHLIQRMATLTAGSALLWQRSHFTEHDMKLGKSFVRASTPGHRGRVLLALFQGDQTVSQIEKRTCVLRNLIVNTLLELEKVHVVHRPKKLVWNGEAPDFDKPGRPSDVWTIAPEPEDPEREALAAERKEEYA